MLIKIVKKGSYLCTEKRPNSTCVFYTPYTTWQILKNVNSDISVNQANKAQSRF